MNPPKTPASLGYHMPAEWERHEATWLSWPQNTETWPGQRLARVEETFLQMLEGILPGEKVHLLVRDEAMGASVKKRLEKMSIRTSHLIFHSVPTADVWIRDYGPTFIKKKSIDHSPQSIEKNKNKSMVYGLWSMDSAKAYIKWKFNAWGGKYPSLIGDTQVFKNTSLISYPCFDAPIILEGGAIEVNGAGTCLVTEQCLLNKNRNPQLSREEIERHLKDYLGVFHVIWLKEGMVGDDTDGHMDDLARFVNPSTLLAVFEEDERDVNHKILKENGEVLKRAVDQDGKKWDVVKLPMPGSVRDREGRLPASYANFFIANQAVLLPVFGHKHDQEAAGILRDYFPKREILPIPCGDLIYGLGAIHCVSQQEPA